MKKYKRDPLWGAVTQKMELQIPYRFEWLGNFSEGLGIFKAAERSGFCDEQGNQVIPPRYREVNVFRGGLAPATEDELFGFIDPNGTFIIPAHFDYAVSFAERRAVVHRGDKRGFILRDGSWVRQPDLDYANSFSEGFASVERGNEYFYVDENGKRVGPNFDLACGDFHSGRSLCKLGGKNVIIDRNFRILSTLPEFEWISLSPRDDVLRIGKAGKYGYADLEGRIVMEPVFDGASAFYESRARVKKGRKWAILAAEGRKITHITDFILEDWPVFSFREGFAECKIDGVFKFVRADGVIMNEAFSLAQPFSCGLAAVCSLT